MTTNMLHFKSVQVIASEEFLSQKIFIHFCDQVSLCCCEVLPGQCLHGGTSIRWSFWGEVKAVLKQESIQNQECLGFLVLQLEKNRGESSLARSVSLALTQIIFMLWDVVICLVVVQPFKKQNTTTNTHLLCRCRNDLLKYCENASEHLQSQIQMDFQWICSKNSVQE